jgi:hypothetical protein
MSLMIIADANLSKLNKRITLRTEDTAIWTDNRVGKLLTVVSDCNLETVGYFLQFLIHCGAIS